MSLIRPKNPKSFVVPAGHKKLNQDDYDNGLTYDAGGKLHFYGTPFGQELKLNPYVNWSIVAAAIFSGCSFIISFFSYLDARNVQGEPFLVELTNDPRARNLQWDCDYGSLEPEATGQYTVQCKGTPLSGSER